MIEALFYIALGIVRGLFTCPRTRIEIKPEQAEKAARMTERFKYGITDEEFEHLLPTEAEWREFEHEITREGGRA